MHRRPPERTPALPPRRAADRSEADPPRAKSSASSHAVPRGAPGRARCPQQPSAAGIATRIAASVASMSASVCAVEMKPVS